MTSYGGTTTTQEPIESAQDTWWLPDEQDGQDNVDDQDDAAVRSPKKYSLLSFYTSHALFMWNNRSYEFASVLLTAAAFPHTLVAASIRGLSAHLASLLFSASIGKWCNEQSSRLRPVQICIVVQRVCIALACLGWTLITQDDGRQYKTTASKIMLFVALILLGMIERLSAVGNLILVERDWLPLLAEPAPDRPRPPGEVWTLPKSAVAAVAEPLLLKSGKSLSLHALNATTKRIDLVTKLVAPLAVSAVVIGLKSVRYTAILLAIVHVVSCGVELCTTNFVWKACPALRIPREAASHHGEEHDSRTRKALQKIMAWAQGFQTYLHNPTCLPSLAYALEPFSVLALAGSMSTYLLIAGFPLSQITAARTASTTVELASTVLTPWLITWLSRRHESSADNHTDSAMLRPLLKVGLLGLSWQVLCLIPAIAVLVMLPNVVDSGSSSHRPSLPALTIVLCSALVLSRLGPFAYSLVEQQIVQLEVPSNERLEFSGVETALIDLAELARWALLGIFGRPDQFRWIALISFASVAASLLMFTMWIRRSRMSPAPT